MKNRVEIYKYVEGQKVIRGSGTFLEFSIDGYGYLENGYPFEIRPVAIILLDDGHIESFNLNMIRFLF